MSKRASLCTTNGQRTSYKESHSDHETVSLSDEEQNVSHDSVKQQGVPIDTGWAWVVLFGAWCNFLLSNGTYRAFGVLFIEIQARYESNSSVTSLIVSAINGSYSISALFVNTVGLRYFSSRQFIVLGGIMLASSYSLSALAPNVEVLILLLGCMCGIGQGIIHGPTMTLVSEYFEKYRSIANCITNMGSSVGSLIFSVLIPFWIEEYTFSGTVILLGGLILQITISGLLMRPVSFYNRQKFQEYECKHRHAKVRNAEERGQKVNDFLKHMNEVRKIPRVTDTEIDYQDKFKSKTKSFESPLMERQLSPQNNVEIMQSAPNLSKTGLSHRVGNTRSYLDNSNIGLYTSSDFTFSSMLNMNSKGQDHLEKDLNESKSTCACSKAKLSSIIDCRPMKRIPFLIFIPCACFIVNVAPISIYLPAFAKDLGHSSKECGILITIISITDICTIVFWGIFADRNYIQRYKLLSLIAVTVGVTTCFTPLFNSYTIFIVYSIIYGIFGRVYFSLFPVVLVDFIGLENLRSAFGILSLIQAGTVAILQVVIGVMRDYFNSYVPAMLLISTLVIAGGLMVLALPVAARFEKRKQTEEQAVVEVD